MDGGGGGEGDTCTLSVPRHWKIKFIEFEFVAADVVANVLLSPFLYDGCCSFL